MGMSPPACPAAAEGPGTPRCRDPRIEKEGWLVLREPVGHKVPRSGLPGSCPAVMMKQLVHRHVPALARWDMTPECTSGSPSIQEALGEPTCASGRWQLRQRLQGGHSGLGPFLLSGCISPGCGARTVLAGHP